MSDLHFKTTDRKAESEEEIAVRAYYLNHLLAEMEKVTKEYPVDYVFITGESIYAALMNKNGRLKKYLERVSAVCGESVRRIYLCQGSYPVGYEKEWDTYKFCIYEIDDIGLQELCINTVYEFDGRRWYKYSERIDLGPEKKKKNSPHRFCVMWWTKIGKN